MNNEIIDIMESITNEIGVYIWVQNNAPPDIRDKSITLSEDICEKAQSLTDFCVRPDQPPTLL